MPILYITPEVTMQEIFQLGLFIFSLLSFLVSLFTLSKLFTLSVDLKAFKNSTHTVQYVGATKSNISISDKVEEEISEFQKEYREESQIAYPQFATFEEDLELRGL